LGVKRSAGEEIHMSVKEAISEAVRKRCRAEPAWYAVLYEFYEGARSGAYLVSAGQADEIPLSDLVLQHAAPLDELAAGLLIAHISYWQNTGQAVWASIKVGHTPFADRFVDQNTAALADLPDPFTADVWCGKATSDGIIRWRDDPALPASLRQRWLRSAPLEIGDCDPRVLWFHLLRSWGFARWPYESERLYLFLRSLPAGSQP
jgi:hypothetical protein